MTIAILPETAPFNSEQRAWLNGFLAGWLGINGEGASTAPALAAAAAAAATLIPSPVAEPEPAPEPWHDPSLSIDERLKLSDGEALPHRLMSAMAQLDCGACGYQCRTYAEAIADGAEKRLTLCSPGGSETSKALKRLLKEQPAVLTMTPPATAAHVHGVSRPETGSWSRENPYTAQIVSTTPLNQPGSEKETRHVEIELGGEGPTYSVGDSLGVYPENCDALAEELVAVLGATGDEPVEVGDGAVVPLATALRKHCCLSEVTEDFLLLLADTATDIEESTRLRELVEDDEPIAGSDVLDVLRAFPSARLAPSPFVAALARIKPRLYSISSSPRRHSGQVHLTVRRVAYEHNGRGRKGVASTMLADRVAPGSAVRVFVQPSHGFSLPANPSAAMIMIGPGTGIAPFRAFLHERDATGASGKNWLFFGDQRSEFDFLYKEELSGLLSRGLLTRLETAFSRDQGRKVYVQDRIVEHGEELYRWINEGAYIYVCGDAKRMAADVDRALRAVVQVHGHLDADASKAYVARLASEQRYRKDVY
ncbi:NAD(P)H-dependent nitrite reductase flavoprotein subunit [Singulisphaera sp. GP187]|uniref:sulfite reductase subunit alpha n=1 Tax=Singulisphaera sp. GP187 TaxID=1882752 RepID=UPI00092C3EBB|nr:sulfite reductase subunit alpha [Singulisphaera sp. GP187]SIO24863.1 NAD(P)H-dependent nitrite reductase flavoprotein subunit [Singulisphaera sp. GP187]